MTEPSEQSTGSRWIATILLTAIYVLHSVDRFVISVVIEPLRHEFHLDDTQLGALGGLAHAIAYSAFVLPIGWLLDRTNRVKLLSAMLGVWSLITAFGAFAAGYWHLFAVRMGVGAAEAATSPSIQSLVGSLFSVKARASAMGVIYSGVAIGTGLIFAVGGLVADAFGWRAVFLVAGLPGVLLACVIWLTMKEPPRSYSRKTIEKAPPMSQAIVFVAKSPAILFSVIGLTLASMSVSSAWTWITPILVRQHDFSLTDAGLLVGAAAGVIKFGSTFVSGFLGDLVAKGSVRRLWVVPSCALALSFPAALGVAFGYGQLLIVVFVLFIGFTLGTHYAAPRAIIVSVTPEHMRGSVSSVEQLIVNLFGAGAGPLITGFISDTLGGENSIGLALVATLAVNLVAALCFWISARSARDAEVEIAH